MAELEEKAEEGVGGEDEQAENERDEEEDGQEQSREDGDDGTGAENGESGMEVEASEADSQADTVRILDQLLFSILSTLRKICGVCLVLRGSTHFEIMNRIWGKYIIGILLNRPLPPPPDCLYYNRIP